MGVIKKKSAHTLLPKSMNPASTMDRLAAQLIDLCLLFSFSFGISILFGAFGAVISGAGSVLYFWLCHQFGGQTVGKKIIGLRVISVHSHSLNVFRVLLRETLGRALCLGTALLGYFGILIRRDGRGLHDLISGSIVVSEKRYQTTAAHFFGILLATVLTFSFSIYYVLFKTPVLATVGMHLLNSQGMGIGSLTGNIESGWKINTLYGSNSFFSFSVKGIHIKHDKAGLFNRGVWHLTEVSVDEVKLRMVPGVLNFNYFEKGLVSSRVQLPLTLPYGFLSLKAAIDLVKAKKITILEDKKMNLVFTDVNVNKMTYQANTLNIDNLQSGKSSVNKLEVSQLIYNLENQKLLLKVKLFAKKEAYPILKKDLQASFSWSGALQKPERFRFVTFEDRLSIDFFRNDLLLTLHGFTPATYFYASPVFKNINTKLRNSNCIKVNCLQSLQGSGSFYLSSQKIDFKNNSAWFVGTNEEVLPFNYNEVVKALFTPKPILSIVSEETLSNFVSQLYYKKPMDQLQPQEQSVVTRDQVYYKVLRERFDPNRPKHIDTFLLRSPSELSEVK